MVETFDQKRCGAAALNECAAPVAVSTSPHVLKAIVSVFQSMLRGLNAPQQSGY